MLKNRHDIAFRDKNTEWLLNRPFATFVEIDENVAVSGI